MIFLVLWKIPSYLTVLGIAHLFNVHTELPLARERTKWHPF